MTIIKTTPFVEQEIQRLREEYTVYVKVVIDINKKICSAGAAMHYEAQQLLIQEHESELKDIWGGGIDLDTKIIDFNGFVNIKPSQKNFANEIQDENIRKQFEELTKYFFQILYQ